MNCYNHPDSIAVGACVYCGKLFCRDCLVEVNGKMYCKADISNVVNEAKQQSAAASSSPNVIINNSNNNSNVNNNNNMGTMYPQKSKIVALLLCLFVGFLGIHRFYVGKIGTGILYFFTFGFLGIGVLIDLVLIAVGSFRDKAYMPLK